MIKFLAAAISAIFLINAVVALPAPDSAVHPAGFNPSPPATLVDVDADVLVKLAKAGLLKADIDADVLHKRNNLPSHPDYPWSVPPLLDIDLDLIVKLGKAKIIDVNLDLDIFKGHVRRNGVPTPPDLPVLDVDLDVILSLAKQKLLYLGVDIGILSKRINTYAWWYPLIDIDLDLVVKLITAKILDLDVDIDLLKKLGLIKRNGLPTASLVNIDLALIVKLVGIKVAQ